MKKFPLPIHHEKGHLIVLDEAQREWFIRYFPVTENPRIAKAMGVSKETVRRLRKEYGLAKSNEGMAAIQRRRGLRAAKTNEKNGCYDRKRGHAPSEQTIEGNRRYWHEIREGKRKNPIQKLRDGDPKRFAELMERKSNSRKEMIRKEKLRILYGLGRKTSLKVVVMKPFTQSQTHRRCSALKRGYLLDVDCSEGTVGRYTLYYDDQTQRSEAFERNCIADGFKIVRDDG